MGEVTIIGLDLAKNVFQAHGAAADGSVIFRRKPTRARLLSFFAAQSSCVVAMEACASAHFWGRAIGALGHEVRLIAPSYVKPFVKRQKNDAADAEAIAEAASRPTMRLKAMKTETRARRRRWRSGPGTCSCASGPRRSTRLARPSRRAWGDRAGWAGASRPARRAHRGRGRRAAGARHRPRAGAARADRGAVGADRRAREGAARAAEAGRDGGAPDEHPWGRPDLRRRADDLRAAARRLCQGPRGRRLGGAHPASAFERWQGAAGQDFEDGRAATCAACSSSARSRRSDGRRAAARPRARGSPGCWRGSRTCWSRWLWPTAWRASPGR